MNKTQMTKAIQKVKIFHEMQMDSLQDFLNGKVVEAPECISKTQCEFGRWLYDDASKVKKILGSQFYESLDTLHTQWHQEYSKIYKLVFENKKQGFFAKIFSPDVNKLDPMALDKAKLYYVELQAISQELLKVLTSSQRRVYAMSEKSFEE